MGRGLRIKAGADTAHVYELTVSIRAREQRAQILRIAPPAADHDLLPAATFRLGPVIAAPRTVRRIRALGDHAFEAHLAGSLQHLLSRRDEMLDVSDARELARVALQQIFKQLLALRERSRA